MARVLQPYQEIERSIIKKYRKDIWNKFVMGIKEYKMISEGDKIAVCISGGKDSMLLAKCMEHLQKYSDMKFELEFVVMDPGYNPENRQKIIDNAQLMNIPIKMFEAKIFNYVVGLDKNPCYMCARMRRGNLYKFAQDLGCNKIALGHHYDDVIETILMGMIYGGQVQTMMPKLHSKNFKGMELIRPMYMVREKFIKDWARHNNLEFLQCACRFTEEYEKLENKGDLSKRQEIKALIHKLSQGNDFVETNIFKSVYNVNLNTVIEYVYKGKRYNFLDKYDEYIWEDSCSDETDGEMQE
ncbi:MAG: tRNA 2-thiocytidine biosynthesis protein TtcA [Ruminococcus sp.]|nr:tRNA 2-thiocytidine biosynthesis protein TtcA [Ruminococcus sp.]